MNGKIRVLIVDSNIEIISHIKTLIKSNSEIKLSGEVGNGAEAIDYIKNFQPDIVLINSKLDDMSGFDVALQINTIAPYIGIVLMGKRDSEDMIKKAMLYGADDFMEIPIISLKSIKPLYEIKQKQRKHLLNSPLIVPQRQPKVISVFSSKGGVGKTVIASNLAITLSEQTHEDVLLMDLDLQFGNITDMLNISPRSSINELIADKSNIDPKEFNNYLAHHNSGVSVLCSSQIPEETSHINELDLKEILSAMIKSFDYIVMDLPPLFNEITLKAIELSDNIFLVTNMEVPTLRNVKAGIGIMQKYGISTDRISIIINRYSENSDVSIGRIKDFLGISDIYCIDDEPELVVGSINLGEPLVVGYNESKIAKQFVHLTERLIDYKRTDIGKKARFPFNMFKGV